VVGILVSFLVIFILPLKYALRIGLPVALVACLLCILPTMILRYNIPKLMVAYERAKRTQALKEKQAKADEILETIADSTVVMDMIANNNNQAVKDIAQSITGEDAQILVDSISSNENLTPEQKVILGGLFGIVL
jgi:hypothetical protein